MKTDCQWLDSRLEAFFTETLNDTDSRQVREHLQTCAACNARVEGLKEIDPLVRQLMGYRMAQATRAIRQPQPLRIFRPVLLGTVFAAVLLAVVAFVKTDEIIPPPPTLEAQQPVVPETPPPAVEPPEKKDVENGPVRRTKPDDSVAAPAPPLRPQLDSALPGGPDFAVIDSAGYSTTVEDYRGFVLIVGVWSSNQPETIESLNRIYDSYGHNPEVRIRGVAAQRQDKTEGATFPVVFNRGSQLMGLKAGEFLLLDKSGNRRLTGTLAGNTALTRVKAQLDLLGIK